MVFGVVLLIIGSAGLVFSAVQMRDAAGNLPDPEKDAVETLNFDGGGSKTVDLEEGEYEIWTDEQDDFEESNVGSLEVTDEEGNSVFERDESQSMTVDKPGSREKTYEKVGDLDIAERGTYTFETEEEATLYVTESLPFFDFFGSILITILVVIVSIIAAVLGGGLLIWGWLDKKDCPYCGETIPKDSLKCEHCGQDLTQTSYELQSGNVSQEQPPPPEEDRSGRKRER